MLDLGRLADAVACLAEAVAGAPNGLDYRRNLSPRAGKSRRSGRRPAGADRRHRAVPRPASPCAMPPSCCACAGGISFRRRGWPSRRGPLGIADACTFGLKGHALSSLGRHDEAAIAYQDALKLGPEDPYVRHLVVSSGAMPDAKRAPEGLYPHRLRWLRRSIRRSSDLAGLPHPGRHPADSPEPSKNRRRPSRGPVLDLGCGTGMVALAIGDLPLGRLPGWTCRRGCSPTPAPSGSMPNCGRATS